jgi:hypothetical protein
MPYKTVWIQPQQFTTHDSITVFHTYREDDIDAGLQRYWFTVASACSPLQSACQTRPPCPHVFDVRTLSTWLPPTPPREPATEMSWQKFHDSEHAAIRRALELAIRSGELTHAGLSPDALPMNPQKSSLPHAP